MIKTVLKLYYRSISHEYTVNYYKDSTSANNFLGKVEGTGAVGDAIPADLGKFAPAGYVVPGTRSGAENISANGGDVVNVVYSKKTDLVYTVNYYKDSIEEGNYLDKVEGTGTFGEAIPADLSKFAPAGYVVPGTRSGAENISADGGDVVNVVYSKRTDLSYVIHYYKDVIDEEHYLGASKEMTNKTFGEGVILGQNLLNEKIPDGYKNGVQTPAGPYIIKEKDNVIDVLYTKKTNLSYTVNYYKDSIEEGNYLDKVEGTGTFGEAIPADLSKFAPAGYVVPGTRSGAENISADGGDVVNVVYSKDTFSYSVHYFYDGIEDVQALESGIGEFESQVTTYKEKLRTKYALDYVENLPLTIGTDISKNVINVYYALDDNGDEIPDKYQIIFTYVSAGNGSVDGDVEEVHTFKDNDGNYIKPTPTSPKANIIVNADNKYAFDYWTDSEINDYTPDMSKMKSNTYLVNTTFIAYFDVDEIGIEVPNEPDGVPDKYQIKFQYVSEDTNRGTVSGRVTEVKTVYEIVTGEDGNDHRELRPASPDANITVSSFGSYSFNNWTDGSTGYANADEIRAAEFTQSTTFTAQFRFNGGGGTGPGGGGGPSGNTEGNGRYNPSTVGPGTTTITPEDVPLAPLPESPVDVTLIDDGEVPLAPLPKTGQTSMRTTLTMMLSGIFVAVTALSKKRKEEDS